MVETSVNDILDSLRVKAEENMKRLQLPIPRKPDQLDTMELPPELATVSDNDLDNLYDKFTAAMQYIHYAEELCSAELEMAQHNYDLELNIRLSQTTEARKDLMMAKISADDNSLQLWSNVISTLKIQVKLTKGISKGYKSAVRRIQSEKIERSSLRKHGMM